MNDAASWQRARRPEQKRERRDAIVEAAIVLLDEGGLEAASLSAIAQTAGISKANVYRYFESREAILLAVMLDDFHAWLDAFSAALAPLVGAGDLAALAEALARTLAERPRLCTLISSLSSVLERNVGVEVVVDSKRRFAVLVNGAVEAVCATAPALSPAAARAFLGYTYLFVAGTWPAANPPAVVVEVLAREEFAGMRIAFEATVRTHAEALLRGLSSSDP